jgi:hypothetical protein
VAPLPLPKSVRIGALDYKVKTWSPKAADNTGALGLCDRETCKILLKGTLGPQKMAEVLLHEVVHGCFDGAGLRVDLGPHEENIVNGLGYQLLQVIRDNPKLIAFLQGAFPNAN